MAISTIERVGRSAGMELGRLAHFAYEHKKAAGYVLGSIVVAAGLNLGISNFYNVIIDNAAASWAEAMKARLNHLENERYFNSLKVVGSGSTLAEKLDMEKRGGLVNVRNMAGFSLEIIPGLAFETPVIGTVSVGADVYKVILVNGWGVTKCDNIQGFIARSGQNPDICAINYDYLSVNPLTGNQTKPAQNGVVK